MYWHIPAVQPYRSPTLEHASDTENLPCQLTCDVLPLGSWCVYNTFRRISEAFFACRSSDLSSPSQTHRPLALPKHWGSAAGIGIISALEYRVCSLCVAIHASNLSLRMDTKKASILKPTAVINYPTGSDSPGLI